MSRNNSRCGPTSGNRSKPDSHLVDARIAVKKSSGGEPIGGRSWSEHRNKPGDGTVARGNVVFGSAADAALVGLGDNFEFGIQTS